jgi:DNA-binding NarL/FixJ family response regulator
MLRVLVADEHALLRRGVRDVISGHVGWEICGEASDGQQALEIALREKPDVAVLAVSLPIVNGVALTGRLRQECPSTRVLLFTMHDDDETVRGGLAAGARGYVLKTDSEQHLEAAVSALGANRPYFSSFVSELLLDGAVNNQKRSLQESFTEREREVAQLIAEGNSNRQIARARHQHQDRGDPSRRCPAEGRRPHRPPVGALRHQAQSSPGLAVTVTYVQGARPGGRPLCPLRVETGRWLSS